jgi:hypothetical protein
MGTVGMDTNAVAERLAGAIKLRTIAHEEHGRIDGAPFFALHEYLRKSYPLVAEKLSWETVEEYSLLLTWKGKGGGKPLALLAHMDVVPVEPGTEKDWGHGPYSGDIDGGYVWGRGAMDMKGHLVCVLEAVEGLLREGFQPENDVCLCFGHNEEIIEAPRSGAKAIVKLLEERGVALGMIIDEGGVVMPGGMMLGTEGLAAVVGTAEKGYMDVRLSCAQGGRSLLAAAALHGAGHRRPRRREAGKAPVPAEAHRHGGGDAEDSRAQHEFRKAVHIREPVAVQASTYKDAHEKADDERARAHDLCRHDGLRQPRAERSAAEGRGRRERPPAAWRRYGRCTCGNA